MAGRLDDTTLLMTGEERPLSSASGDLTIHTRCVNRVIIKLGPPSGTITGVDIDTAHFNGNEGPAGSVAACFLPDGSPEGPNDPAVSLFPYLFQIFGVLIVDCLHSGRKFCPSQSLVLHHPISSRFPPLRKANPSRTSSL